MRNVEQMKKKRKEENFVSKNDQSGKIGIRMGKMREIDENVMNAMSSSYWKAPCYD